MATGGSVKQRKYRTFMGEELKKLKKKHPMKKQTEIMKMAAANWRSTNGQCDVEYVAKKSKKTMASRSGKKSVAKPKNKSGSKTMKKSATKSKSKSGSKTMKKSGSKSKGKK